MYLYIAGGERPPYKLGATHNLKKRFIGYFSAQYAKTTDELGLPRLSRNCFQYKRTWPGLGHLETDVKARLTPYRLSMWKRGRYGVRRYLSEWIDLEIGALETFVALEADVFARADRGLYAFQHKNERELTLTPSAILSIYQDNRHQSLIADDHGISSQHVLDIKRGNSRTDITGAASQYRLRKLRAAINQSASQKRKA